MRPFISQTTKGGKQHSGELTSADFSALRTDHTSHSVWVELEFTGICLGAACQIYSTLTFQISGCMISPRDSLKPQTTSLSTLAQIYRSGTHTWVRMWFGVSSVRRTF